MSHSVHQDIVNSIPFFPDETVKREPSFPFKDYPTTAPTHNLGEPMVKLFALPVLAARPTEGELKAKRIRNAFKNPFLRFLPAKKFSEISGTEDKTNSSEIATGGADGVAKVSDNDVCEVAHRYTKASERYTKTEGYTQNTPKADSSDKRSKKRKINNPDLGGDEVGTTLRAKKQKKKGSKKHKKHSSNTEGGKSIPSHSQFEAYDYNNASLDFGSAENGGKYEEVFNPYKKLGEKSKKYHSKVRTKSGERSMTFNKGI